MAERQEHSLLSTHWSLGTLILVGLATSELAGAASIVALPIITLSITLSAISAPISRPIDLTTKKRKCGDVVEFLEIWLNILELLTAAATCARVASVTMDYMSKGRLRDWLFGFESHSLGEPWPDVLGVTIVVVTTALFMLGLDKSPSLSILLCLGLAASFFFFITIGSFHADTIFWNWTHDFKLNNWGRILTTAAMCAYAFPNTVPRTAHQTSKSCLKYVLYMMVPLASYISIVVVFTFMSHFRELTGTAIPLVRVFEVRDVDWARPIMAICTIFVSCIALTEIIPSLYSGIMRLASREWKMLISSLLYRNPMTGAPVLAIFTVGSLTSILAFACPLSYLVRLLNVSPLLKCALRTSRALYQKYRSEFVHEELSVQHSSIHYSRLHKGPKKHPKSSPTRRIKTAFDMMPRFLRNTAFGGGPACSTTVEDKEYLLMDDYSIQKDHHDIDTDSESDVNEISSICTDIDADTSSSTDIDAVVQEYKEHIQVTTVNSFNDPKAPTRFTARVVFVSLGIIYVSSSLIGAGILLKTFYLAWSSTIVTLSCMLVVLLMPQNKEEDVLPKKVFPFIALSSVSLNMVLGSTLLSEVWFGVIVWICGGLILFCRCDCCNYDGVHTTSKERLRLQGPKSDCDQHSDHIDAVLITR